MEFWKKLCKKLILFFKKILKRTVWYALGPSQQANVSTNYSQFIKINIGPSDGRTIVPSDCLPMVSFWRLSDLKSLILCGQNHTRIQISWNLIFCCKNGWFWLMQNWKNVCWECNQKYHKYFTIHGTFLPNSAKMFGIFSKNDLIRRP